VASQVGVGYGAVGQDRSVRRDHRNAGGGAAAELAHLRLKLRPVRTRAIRLKEGLEPVLDESRSRFQHCAQLGHLLSFERSDRQEAGDEQTARDRQQGRERDLPSDGQRHPDPSGSLSL
jgi:hypothetical protein